MATLISPTFCDEPILSIEIAIPDLITAFKSLTRTGKTEESSENTMGPASLAEKFMIKVLSKPLSYASAALLLLRRGNEMRPNVELGPGAFKTEILTYPPNYYVGRLKALIKIKQREEALNRNLNAR